MSASDRCLQCHETRGAIRREGLICGGVDYFGELDWEADHHRFAHTVAVRNERPGAALWFAFCACGWKAYDGARFPTREDARIAARAHRSSPISGSTSTGG
jgi:hypothetical protein